MSFGELYGICGGKGHGKDTFANLIIKSNPSFKILQFADDLKIMTSRVFDVPLEILVDPALKEKPFLSTIVMDTFLEKMRSVTELHILNHDKIASTPRELMQFFGTEYVRSVEDDYWLNLTLSKIDNSDRVVIPDVRFLNEFDRIKFLGGIIIRVLRTDLISSDHHPSETELISITPDFTLKVKFGDLSPLEEAARSIENWIP
jgi:hypothetical protein